MKRQAPVELRCFRLMGRDFFLGGMSEACDWLLAGPRGPVHLVNVHTLVTAFWDQGLRQAQDKATLLPDGRPISLAAKLLGVWKAQQVRGPSLMRELCARGRKAGARHYFYGGVPGAAKALVASLKAQSSGLKVAGYESPAFGPVPEKEVKALATRLKRSKADFCWVGLGAPKQELFMARLQAAGVKGSVLGVGAAFDYESGLKREAPAWMQFLALEWLFRLGQEPLRLGWRYLSTLPIFAVACIADFTGPLSGNAAEGLLRLAALVIPFSVHGDTRWYWLAGALLAAASGLRAYASTRKVVHAP